MVDTDELVINMGPQHPSTHGVLRVVLRLDGEKVVDAGGGARLSELSVDFELDYGDGEAGQGVEQRAHQACTSGWPGFFRYCVVMASAAMKASAPTVPVGL